MRYTCVILFLVLGLTTYAQSPGPSYSFIDYQKSFPRISEALNKKEDTLIKQFEEKKTALAGKIYLPAIF